MFLVKKIMYVEYVTDDSKLLNGSVHFRTHLWDTAANIDVLGAMLSPWDGRICRDCTCDLLVIESPVSLVSFFLMAFFQNNSCLYIFLMLCATGVGGFDLKCHMFKLSRRRVCHSNVHCCCHNGTWKQAPQWLTWWCMKWSAWTSAHGVADPTAPCTASTASSE